MKQVWKCEYCSETNFDFKVIAEHESKCVFNPEYKGCYTCKHSYWFYDIRTCNKELNIYVGEQGDCPGYQK